MNTRGVFVLITCLAILMSVMCWLLVSPIQSAQGETVINRLSFGNRANCGFRHKAVLHHQSFQPLT